MNILVIKKVECEQLFCDKTKCYDYSSNAFRLLVFFEMSTIRSSMNLLVLWLVYCIEHSIWK